MSLTLGSVTSSFTSQQRYYRDVNSTIERLEAGVKVRPKDNPAAFASFQRARESENQLRTASLNAERAQAFGSAVLEQLDGVTTALQGLREFYTGPAVDNTSQRKVDELLDQIAAAQQANLKGQPLFITDVPPSALGVGMAVDTQRVEISQSFADQDTRVDFQRSIDDAVVIANLSTANDTDAAHIRLTNIDANGVDLHIEEYDHQDGVHGTETVDLLALAAGSYTLENGQRVEVGRVEVGGDAQRVEFDQTFDAAPIILTTVQSYNDPTAVVVRQGEVDLEGFELYLQEQESLGKDGHGQEVVGFIAIEAGSGTLGDLRFTAGQTAQEVTESKSRIALDQNIDNPVFLTSHAPETGGDTASTRLPNTGSTGATVHVEEETSLNAEVRHVAERAAFLAIETADAPAPKKDPSANAGLPTPSAGQISITPDLALRPDGWARVNIDPASLGNKDHQLTDLRRGGELDLNGDRDRALRVIDAALDQVNASVAETRAFVRYTVGSVDRVNRTSLAATRAFRQSLEDRSGLEAANEARRLLLRSAGQTLVTRANQERIDILLSLVEQTGDRNIARPKSTEALQALHHAQQTRLVEALDAYNTASALTPSEGTGLAPSEVAEEGPGIFRADIDIRA